MQQQAPALVGTILDGKYRIEEALGAGGMGTVYRGLHLSLGLHRAIKVMKLELAGDAAFVARFQREARLAARLRHPHLVTLHDFAQLPDGTWYSVSDLVEGETLGAQVAARGAFPGEEVARLLGQIAEGLALAHEQGIVHRDISPDNVMVTRADDGAPVAKLLDFGIAKEILAGTGDTESGLLLGKLGFASPEQIGLVPQGTELDARTDVFSLSALAYYILTGGRLPWRRDTLPSYIHDMLVRPEADTLARLQEDLPPAWQATLAAGLARQREKRVATARALKAGFEQAAGRRAARPATRARWKPAAIATASAAVALLAAYPWVGSERTGTAPAPSPLSSTGRAAPTLAPPVAAVAADPSRVSNKTPRPGAARTPKAPPAMTSDTPTAAPPSTLAPSGYGSLSVGADVWMLVSVDGGPARQTPARFERLAAGRHTVNATRDGYEDIQTEAEIHAGESQRVVLSPRKAGP